MSYENKVSGRERLSNLDYTGTKESKSNDVESRQLPFQPFTIHIVSKAEDLRNISNSYKSFFNSLDPSLTKLFQFSEKENSSIVRKTSSTEARIPSIAVVVFCYDDEYNLFKNHENLEDKASCETYNKFSTSESYQQPRVQEKSNVSVYRKLKDCLGKFPWAFHHKVSISGSMKICEGNVQDYFYYRPLDFGYNKSYSDWESLPLLGARKIHDGKPILRTTVFVTSKKWQQQISFYSRLCESPINLIRDDFCLFELKHTLNKKFKMQLGLKRLPEGLRPKQLLSTFLEFEVRKYDTVSLTPHELEPMSDIRMRTRDHDGSTIILIVPNKKIKYEIELHRSSFKKEFKNIAQCRSQIISPLKINTKNTHKKSFEDSKNFSNTATTLPVKSQSFETKLNVSNSSEVSKKNLKMKRNFFEITKSVDLVESKVSLISCSKTLSVTSKKLEKSQKTPDKNIHVKDYDNNENMISIRDRIAKFESPENNLSKILLKNPILTRKKSIESLDDISETFNITNEKFTYPKLPKRMPLINNYTYKSFENNKNNNHWQKRSVSAVPYKFYSDEKSEQSRVKDTMNSSFKDSFYV